MMPIKPTTQFLNTVESDIMALGPVFSFDRNIDGGKSRMKGLLKPPIKLCFNVW